MTERQSGDGSRVEAAEAGVHAEIAEAEAGRTPEEHVTATEVATEPPPLLAHHHPADPNAGVVRGRLGRGAVLAGTLAAAVTIAAVVLLAIAIGGS
jgi:hypothetical protein